MTESREMLLFLHIEIIIASNWCSLKALYNVQGQSISYKIASDPSEYSDQPEYAVQADQTDRSPLEIFAGRTYNVAGNAVSQLL